MKSSIFNTSFRVNENKWLIYNSFTNKFVCIINDTDPLLGKTFQSTNCTFKHTLYDNGFLVNDDTDETKSFIEKLNQLMNDGSMFELHINPTLDCNLNCWYCYENHIKGSTISVDNLERITQLIKRISDKPDLKHLYISFFGGEPLLRFEGTIKKIILAAEQVCQKKNISLHYHFTSNGFLISEKISEFFKNRDVRFQITLDGDEENHNKVRHLKNGRGTYDKILNGIERLSKAGCYITIRINYTIENIYSIDEVLRQIITLKNLNHNRTHIDLQRVWQDSKNKFDDTSIIKKYETFLKENGILYSCPNKRDQSLHICYGDKHNYMLINYNGDVYKCTARDFTQENRVGVLTAGGDISWDKEKIDRWEKAKLSRSQCLKCPIVPICGGGCRQKCIETKDKEGCLLGYDEDRIKSIIFDKFLALSENNYKNLFYNS